MNKKALRSGWMTWQQNLEQGLKRKKSVQLRMRASLLLIVSLVVAVVALVGSQWAHDSISHYAVNEYGNMLQDVVNLIDAGVASYRAYAQQLGSTSWVKRIAYMQGSQVDASRVSNLDLQDYSRDMNLYKAASGVHAAGLIFMDKNLVIASGVKCDIPYLANNYMQVDGLTEEGWIRDCRAAARGEKVFYPDIQLSNFFSKSQAMLMFFPLYTVDMPNACVMFVVVRHKDFSAYFDGMLSRGEPMQVTVSAEGAEKPFLTLRDALSGETTTITRISAQTGLRISLTIPQVIVQAEVIAKRNVLLGIVGAMWLILVLAGLAMTRRFFKPLRQLLNLMEDETPLRRDINEFDSLQRGIEELKQREAGLSVELALRQVYLRNAELERLLSGLHTPEEEQRRLAEFTREFDHFPRYRVCLILWRSDPAARELPSAQAVEAVLQGAFREKETGEAFVLRRLNHHILVAGYHHPQEFNDAITALFEKWEKSYIALGSEAGALTGIQESFETAQAAKDYRCVSDGFRVLRYEIGHKSIRYYMPQEMENQLISFIYSGQSDRALAVFQKIYQANMSERGTTYKGMQNLMVNIGLSIVKILPADAIVEPPAVSDDLAESCAAMEAYISDTAQGFADRLQEMPNRMENILAYVNSNLMDATLSLDMVAEHFDVSASLISRLFTEQYGENFHAFVNRRRIARATEYLADGGDDIAQVAQQVGYANDVTFRRMFKRFVGLTPSAYRASMRME